jgi:hypothetical protein
MGLIRKQTDVNRINNNQFNLISRVFSEDVLIKQTNGYISSVCLCRTGSKGGNSELKLYDGLDNTGAIISKVVIGGEGGQTLILNSVFLDGLYLEISGTGNYSATISYK